MRRIGAGNIAEVNLPKYLWAAIAPFVLIICQLPMGGGNNSSALGITVVLGLLALAISVKANSFPFLDHIRALSPIITAFGLILTIGVGSLWPLTVNLRVSPWYLVAERGILSVDYSQTMIELIKFCGLSAVFLVGLMLGYSRRTYKSAISTLTICLTLYGILAIVLFASMPTSIMGFGTKELFVDRLTASYLSANTAGTLFGMSVVLALGVILSKTVRHQRESGSNRHKLEPFLVSIAVPVAAVVVCGVALIMTQSRSAMAITTLTLASFIAFIGVCARWKRIWIFSVPLTTIVVAGCAAYFAASGALINRVADLPGDTFVRSNIYISHWGRIMQRPLIGFGFGSFARVNRNVIDVTNYRDLWVINAMHNVYLQWIESAGCIGAFIMFACIGYILYRIAGIARYSLSSAISVYTILGVSAVVIFHGFTDFALENPSLSALWAFLLGLGLSQALAWENRAKNFIQIIV